MSFVANSEQIAFMEQALVQARLAGQAGEVPVGAVVIFEGKVIAAGRNCPIAAHDPTAHAEVVALREAAGLLGNYRLDGCDLYVTLEPCTMCCGAILQARLKNVYFGATDPKTGMAGSITNLFANSAINHQTQVQGGILATQCAALLHGFFAARRARQRLKKLAQHPLRDDALRTADAGFERLADYPWQPHYISNLHALGGLRLHYIDEGPSDAPLTFLCLHGNPTWSYVFRRMIPAFLDAGYRVIAPDLIGFGRSDKPKKAQGQGLLFHRRVVLELIERLGLSRIVLVGHEWGAQLGMTLPLSMPTRFVGLLTVNAAAFGNMDSNGPARGTVQGQGAPLPHVDIAAYLSSQSPPSDLSEFAAYKLPFPEPSYRAGISALEQNEGQIDATLVLMADQEIFWNNNWRGQCRVVYSALHPDLSVAEASRSLCTQIYGSDAAICMGSGRIFSEEADQAIAHAAITFFQTNLGST